MEVRPQFGRLSSDRNGAGCSPFRYPGGKAFLADELERRIASMNNTIEVYAEAYAGGAGAAVELLARGVVSKIILNDFDRRVHSVWWAILHRTQEFIDRIAKTPVNMETWRACRALAANHMHDADPFDLGFATYFLNRTNHSGVVLGAGPIGGYNQTGRWLIDARYYADTMIRRIKWLGDRRDFIELRSLDGLEFLQSFSAIEARGIFFFIDPPYVSAGKKLYLDAMSETSHRELARFLTDSSKIPNWLVTYDDSALIREAYAHAKIEPLQVRYSLHRKRTANELCVARL